MRVFKKIAIYFLVFALLLSGLILSPLKGEAAAKSKQYTLSGTNKALSGSFDLPADFGAATKVTISGGVGTNSVDLSTRKLNVSITDGWSYTTAPDPNSQTKVWGSSFKCDGSYCNGTFSVSPRVSEVENYVYFESRTKYIYPPDNENTVNWYGWSPINYHIEGAGYAVFDLGNVPVTYGTVIGEVKGYASVIKTYNYIITLEYTTNSSPVLAVTNSGDKTLYNNGGSFSISGTVADSDNDKVTVSATIGGITKSVIVSNTSSAKSWTLTWLGTEVPVGTYTGIVISATDGISSLIKANYSGRLIIQPQIYYYWSKFNVNTNKVPNWSKPVSLGQIGWTGKNYYGIDSNDNFYVYGDDRESTETTVYKIENGILYAYRTYGTYLWDGQRQYASTVTTLPPTKGTLIQANIKAVQGTYPDNGIHSDGFWYVKSGSVPNNMPILFLTQSGDKTINLKTGFDTFTLTGQVTDADNETLSVSATIGGVTKQVGVSNTGTAKTWTLTWRTSEFSSNGTFNGMQIIADDGHGGVSTSSYSGILTVNKTPLYYWDKYSTKQVKVYSEKDWEGPYSEVASAGGFPDYKFNQLTGKYEVIGSYQQWSLNWASYLFTVDNNNVLSKKFPIKRVPEQFDKWDVDLWQKRVIENTTTVKDQLIQSNIQELDGTYPDNGIHTDGFWYTKKATTNMIPVLRVDNSDIAINAMGSELRLNGTVSDADGDSVTVKAKINNIEKTVTLTNTSRSQSWTLTWNSNEVPEGMYSNIEIQADDGKGGVDRLNYLGTIIVDRTPPAAPLIQVDNEEWTDQDVNVVISDFGDAGSGVSTVEYQLNDGAWTSYAGPLVINIDGETTIKARVTDRAGNRSSETVQVVKIVKDPPTTPTLTPSTGGWTKGPVTVDLSGSTGNGAYEYQYKINNEEYVTGNQVEVVDEGTTVVTGRAINAFGMTSPESSITVTIDKTKPVISLTPNGRSWSSDPVDVSISVNDLLSGLKPNSTYYKVTTSAQEPADWELLSDPSQPIQLLNEGQWFIHVKATDLAGNTEIVHSSVYQLQEVPEKPTLQATDVQHDQVTLTWDLPAGDVYTDGYEYELHNTGTGAVYKINYPKNQVIDPSVTGGREYGYELTVKNHVGQAVSDELKILTKPNAPENLKVIREDREYSRARLVIDPMEGATSQHIVVENIDGNLLMDEVTADNQFMIDGMQAGTIYKITVSGMNASGEGPTKSVSYLSLPAVPGGFSAVQIREESIELEWMSVTGATYYNLERFKQTIYDGYDLHYTDLGLESGSVYDYRLAAANESGEGQYSELAGLITLPGKLNDLKMTDATTNSVKFIWPYVHGAEEYRFELNDGQQISVTGDVYEATFYGLQPGTNYTLTGFAQNRSGQGETVSLSFETLPLMPEGIMVSEIKEGSATISWNPVYGARKYRVILDGQVYEVSGVSQEIVSLSGSKRISISVEAGNSSGYGAAASGEFTTLPRPPSNLQVKEVGSDRVVLSWDPDDTATKYYAQPHGGAVIELSVPEAELSGLEAGVSYVFDVWTQNETGEGKKTSVHVTTKTESVNPEDIEITVEEDKVTIDFKPVDHAEDYVVLDGNGTEIWRGQEGPIVISPVTPGKSYDYEIVAENSQGVPSDPTEIHFVAIPGSPEGIFLTEVKETSVTFDLSQAVKNGAAEIVVYRDGKEIDRIDAGEEKYSDKALKANQTYEYEFKAANASGESSEGVKLNVTTKPEPASGAEGNSGGGGGSTAGPITKPESPKPTEPKPEEIDGEPGTKPENSHSANGSSTFQDVSSASFAKEAIDYLVEQKIVKGVTDKMFEPNRPISRMEFAALIVRATNAGPNNTLEITYKDINKSGWYMEELNAAISNQIAIGFNDNEFRPHLVINREQGAKMLGNAASRKYGVTQPGTIAVFTDKEEVALWADEEVNLIAGLKILEGYPDGSFRPKGDLTRAESAVLIYRLMQLKN